MSDAEHGVASVADKRALIYPWSASFYVGWSSCVAGQEHVLFLDRKAWREHHLCSASALGRFLTAGEKEGKVRKGGAGGRVIRSCGIGEFGWVGKGGV